MPNVPQEGNDYIMSNHLSEQPRQLNLFATAGYPVLSNEKTLSDKLNTCGIVSPPIILSETSEEDSTSNEKGFLPYWNSSVADVSKRLWSPTKTALPDLDTTLSDGWSSVTVDNSWFSTMWRYPPKKNLSETSLLSCTVSPADSMDAGNTVRRAKKIRLYPTEEQRHLLRQWMGTARFVYNYTVEYLKQPGTKARWKALRKEILEALPGWAKPVPHQIKAGAVKDACEAVKNAKKKYKQTGKIHEVKFRSRKAQRDALYIPKTAVRKQSVYYTVLGESLAPREPFPEIRYDCRLLFHRGDYYLCVPYDKPYVEPENQRHGVVALDPGVRTFISFYSEGLAGKFGGHDFGRIYRLCYHLDALMSKISKAKSRKKYQLRKAAARLRKRIQALISEIHRKVAKWLCQHFKCILLPTFETSQMVTKLRSKTARSMLTWAHYRFKQTLKCKAEEYQAVVLDVCEAYTSKTCSVCGHIQNIGSREEWNCRECGTRHDRDLNGARGIFLRALGDTPSHFCIV